MSSWRGRLQRSDFELDQDYRQRLKKDFEDVFDALRRVRDELERTANPQPNKRVEYLLTDSEELVEYLQKTVNMLQDQMDQILSVAPDLLAERDQLIEESDHSVSQMRYLNWLIDSGLADQDDDTDDD